MLRHNAVILMGLLVLMVDMARSTVYQQPRCYIVRVLITPKVTPPVYYPPAPAPAPAPFPTQPTPKKRFTYMWVCDSSSYSYGYHYKTDNPMQSYQPNFQYGFQKQQQPIMMPLNSYGQEQQSYSFAGGNSVPQMMAMRGKRDTTIVSQEEQQPFIMPLDAYGEEQEQEQNQQQQNFIMPLNAFEQEQEQKQQQQQQPIIMPLDAFEQEQQQPLYPLSPNSFPKKVEVSVVFRAGGRNIHSLLMSMFTPLEVFDGHLTLDILPNTRGGCRLGPTQCLTEFLNMCAVDSLPTPATQLAFSACLVKDTLNLHNMSIEEVMDAAKKCLEPHSASAWNGVTTCVDSGHGQQLLASASHRLRRLAIGQDYYPVVALNKEVVIADGNGLPAFPALLCDKLRQTPEAENFCSF